MSEKQRINSMDFMRVSSIFLIITFHLYIEWLRLSHRPSDDFISTFGTIGVSFFIIISGGALSASTKNIFKCSEFYLKRIATIYPAFWVSYLIAFLYIWIVNNNLTGGSDLKLLTISFFGLDGYLHSMYKTYYLVGEWFLGFIIIIYALFPAVLYLYNKNKLLTLFISIVIACLSINFNDWFFSHSPLWNKYPLWNPTARLPEFIFGMILFDLIKERKASLNYLIAISIVIIAATYYGGINIHKPLAIPALCSIFMLIAIVYEKMPPLSIVNKKIELLSKYSFLAFLAHHVVIQQVIPQNWIATSNGSQLILLLFLALSISFGYAVVIYPICDYARIIVLKVKSKT
ncbi:acyltransferase family protein [Enterobacter soli]|uniref:acyltransferase family protein n=1 Tax=Enterobacter soli TaxID=885040 RepID=UPI00310AA8F2